MHFSSTWYLLLCIGLAVVPINAGRNGIKRTREKAEKEDWGYVTVRKDAHMFWWLYNHQTTEASIETPLILWLQGGPGGSGTGFGNFAEIGPLDVNLAPRNSTWLKAASLLFVDNPVGTGYSYVTNPDAYAKTVDQIGEDIVFLFRKLYKKKPELEKKPLFVFSESYGGKMAAVLAVHLYKAIAHGDIRANFRGVAMGDSWIHPELIVHSWGTYLYSTSVLDGNGQKQVDDAADLISEAIAVQNWSQATELWDAAENVVSTASDGVDWYNILNPLASHEQRIKSSQRMVRKSHQIESPSVRRLYQRHSNVHQNDALDQLMNGPIRQKLGIIPANVTWGGQSAQVFANQANEFMKPVTNSVDFLLQKTELQVVVYNGQLDLICDSIGVEAWVQTLKWPNLPKFNAAPRTPVALVEDSYVVGFVKGYERFSFYWMLRAGHMLPADQGQAALRMVDLILAS